jgi:hypothetical protein
MHWGIFFPRVIATMMRLRLFILQHNVRSTNLQYIKPMAQHYLLVMKLIWL